MDRVGSFFVFVVHKWFFYCVYVCTYVYATMYANIMHNTHTNAEQKSSHRGSISNMGVVALSKQRHDSGALLGNRCEHEAKACNGGPTHVVRHVADCHVQQPSDCAVVACA